MTSDGIRAQVHAAAQRARTAAAEFAMADRATKDACLAAIADALEANVERVLSANAGDLEAGEKAGLAPNLLDRLRLTEQRVRAIAAAVRNVAALPDPVGHVVRGSVLANGLRLSQVRVPLGVIGMVYEARPNVTVDAAVLALKSGNVALLRGSSSAEKSNSMLTEIMRGALVAQGMPADAVQLLPCHDRSSVQALITARGLVDLVIPRGGAGLINAVVTEATVPTVETGVGNVHVYVDASADVDIAERIVLNSKTRRTSVCNAAENLLVHKDIAPQFVPRVTAALRAAGVTVHAGPSFAALTVDTVPATDEDFDTEYLSLDIAADVVADLDAAIDHIARHSSGHTEAIVTTDLAAAQRFTTCVDAAAVMVNASTAFTDGEQFGLGAEIGISTQKTHARGPLGLAELTSTKWVVVGEGHIRSAS